MVHERLAIVTNNYLVGPNHSIRLVANSSLFLNVRGPRTVSLEHGYSIESRIIYCKTFL